MTSIQWAIQFNSNHAVVRKLETKYKVQTNMKLSPTCLLYSGNKLYQRSLLRDIFLCRHLSLFFHLILQKTPEWVMEMNEFKKDLVVHSFSTTGRLGGQDLFIWAPFCFCWGRIVWFQSQINHQETADPQNMAFRGFYAHTTEAGACKEQYIKTSRHVSSDCDQCCSNTSFTEYIHVRYDQAVLWVNQYHHHCLAWNE